MIIVNALPICPAGIVRVTILSSTVYTVVVPIGIGTLSVVATTLGFPPIWTFPGPLSCPPGFELPPGGGLRGWMADAWYVAFHVMM